MRSAQVSASAASKSGVREELGRRLPGDLDELAARRAQLEKMVRKLELLVEEACGG